MKKMLKIVLYLLAISFVISAGFLAFRIIHWNNVREEPGLSDLLSVEEFYSVENGIVYIGRESCEHCQLFKPILSDILNDGNWQIYHLDTQYLREETDISEEDLQAFFQKYDIKGVPMLLELKDGELLSASHISKYKKHEIDLMQETALEYLQEKMNAYAQPTLLSQSIALLISTCALFFALLIGSFWYKGVSDSLRN